MTSVIVREKRGRFDTQTHTRRSCEDRGRDCSDVTISQGTLGAIR